MSAPLILSGRGIGFFQVSYTSTITGTLPVSERGVAGSLWPPTARRRAKRADPSDALPSLRVRDALLLLGGGRPLRAPALPRRLPPLHPQGRPADPAPGGRRRARASRRCAATFAQDGL